MKRTLLLISIFCTLLRTSAQAGIYQQGTVVRMRVGDCKLVPRHGFVAKLSGTPPQPMPETCPEYTLVTENVVYVLVGKSSNQLIPLAEIINFRFHNNEVAVRVDDARHETCFAIKEMMLRSEWEQTQHRFE